MKKLIFTVLSLIMLSTPVFGASTYTCKEIEGVGRKTGWSAELCNEKAVKDGFAFTLETVNMGQNGSMYADIGRFVSVYTVNCSKIGILHQSMTIYGRDMVTVIATDEDTVYETPQQGSKIHSIYKQFCK